MRDTISTIYRAICLGRHLKLAVFHWGHRDGGKEWTSTSFPSRSGFTSRHRAFCIYFLLYLVFSLHPGVPFLVSAPATAVVRGLQSTLPRTGSATAWRTSQAGSVPAACAVEGDGQGQRSWLRTRPQLYLAVCSGPWWGEESCRKRERCQLHTPSRETTGKDDVIHRVI